MKILVFLMLCLSACQSSPPTQSTRSFSVYEDHFFQELWRVFPTWATQVGFHEHDAELPIPDAERQKKERDFYLEQQRGLHQWSDAQLSASDRMDYELIYDFIQSALWKMDEVKSWNWDPSQYDLGSTIASVLEGHTKNESQKLTDLSQKLSRVPSYYAAAFKMITVPTREHSALAIKQNEGLLHYLDHEVSSRFQKSDLSDAEKKLARDRLASAHAAVQGFVDGLKSLTAKLQKKNAFRSFRVGKELYGTWFQHDLQCGLTPDALYEKAIQAQKEVTADLVKRSQSLWPKYFPKQEPPRNSMKMVKALIAKISEDHIQPSEFLATIRDLLPKLSAFIEKKDLLTLDPSKPLQVRETPVYERGFAGAGVDAPGLGDPNRETYYNVTPLDGMPASEQQSYLREYNNYTLQILNIHEAIPGHYVQLVYNLKNPSPAKKVFGNGAMIEGWAVYSERMMLEEGYGDQSPELNLMFDKWRLREITNTILDYSLHTKNMSRKEALHLMIDEAFQEKAEAEEKWNRATYSVVQLASYFAGSTAIYDFREEMKKALGTQFQLKKFHEDFLSYGSAPIPAIIHQMKCRQMAAFPKENCI